MRPTGWQGVRVCHDRAFLDAFLGGMLVVLVVLLGDGRLAVSGDFQHSQPSIPGLLYPDSDPSDTSKNLKPEDWLKIIRTQISPLTHERGHRWPLMLIAGVGFKPLPEADIQMLLARGIVQHLEPKETSLPAARALQKAGSPVILMAGGNGAWPYSLEKDKTQWAHHYPEDLKVLPRWRDLPSPTRFSGWAVAGNEMRTILRRFKKAGVTVDALWLDYENEPSQADYFAAILSPTTRALLPPEVVESEAAFRVYCRQLWVQLLSTYMAGPAREIFPKISVTNWVATLSSPEIPVFDWEHHPHPPMGPTLFTATNPVAYGIDTAFLASWKKSYRLDQEHVNRFYMHVLLRQISADSENRQRLAPYMDSVPWVGRWVVDHPDRKVPIMSRAYYREALRHMWLRGVDGMQVFNPSIFQRLNRVNMALAEVQDAVSVYDEMLAYRSFLEKGTVMHFRYPKPQEKGPVWSGLRLEDEAIVRVFWQGPAIGRLRIEPWKGAVIALNNPTRGATFHLRRDKKTNKVRVHSVSR